MKDKITLDIDFDKDDTEKTNDKTSKKNNENYIKNLILEGLSICEGNEESLTYLLEDIDTFAGCGVNNEMINILEYLQELFGDILPCLLIGDYENILIKCSNYDSENDLAVLKQKRIDLIKSIQKNRR